MKTIYVAGPMRNQPRYNFDAFYSAEETLSRDGWNVLNPARMDEELGFDPDRDIPDTEFLEAAMVRDIHAIMESDALALLPGWEKSTGATAEMWVARWRHIPIYLLPEMKQLVDGGV